MSLRDELEELSRLHREGSLTDEELTSATSAVLDNYKLEEQGGWHSDPWGQAESRWWDGTNWTEQTRPPAPTNVQPPSPPPGQPLDKPWYGTWSGCLTAVFLFTFISMLGIGVTAGIIDSRSGSEPPATQQEVAPELEPEPDPEPEPTPTPEREVIGEPDPSEVASLTTWWSELPMDDRLTFCDSVDTLGPERALRAFRSDVSLASFTTFYNEVCP